MTTNAAAWTTSNNMYSGFAKRPAVRSSVINGAICMLIFGALIRVAGVELSASGISKNLTLPQAQLVALKKTISLGSSAKPAPTAGTSTASSTPPAVSQPAALVPNCTPDTSYAIPGGLSLEGTAGLAVQIDPIHYYQIYGYNSGQVRQQIITCAPRLGGSDDYTGYAAYNLAWRYGYTVVGQNTCKLSGVAVGMHIGEVLPAWRSAPLASATFTSDWQHFMTALSAHEQGHIAIDKQYADKVLGDLNALPESDCTDLGQQAAAVIKFDVAALNAANDNYDSVTDHGATQGAILP